MPKHEIVIALNGIDNDTALAFVSLTMQQLNWPVAFVVENKLIGSTSGGGWNSKGEEIVCTTDDHHLMVSSEMLNGAMADVMGKNKKNCKKFEEVFKSISTANNTDQLTIAKAAVAALRVKTTEQIAADEQEAIEIDKAMNLSGSNLYITYTIIAINVLVFVLMVINGAGLIDANGYVHLKWGSNYGPLTLSGDWWRLVTNMFIHFGVIHLALNMYCLYTVGIYLEPMLGKIKYAAAYVCTGILASIVSLYWHTEPANSAGASGAVFGVYGLFFALLTSNLIPKKIRKAQLQSIGIFIVYNLVYGLKGGIDNAAHIGGLLSGLVFGYAYVFSIRKEKEGQAIKWMVPLLIVATVGIAGYYLHENQQPTSGRNAILSEINGAAFKDHEKFNSKLLAFDDIQVSIDKAIGDTSLSNEQLLAAIDATALPQYERAIQLINSTKSYDVSPASHQKADMLLQYLELKKEEMGILKKLCQGQDPEQLMIALKEVRLKANDIFDQALKL